ncbi:MAG: response regulator [Myxococcota bacterium]
MTEDTKQPTVLVVDDSEVCLELARDALEEAGFRVVTTSSPLGVNRLIAQERPAVVVLDVSMPALEGNKLAEVVQRHQGAPVPILLHSDRSVDELRELAKGAGIADYVEKSDDGQALVRMVRLHAGRRSRARERP